MKPSHRLFLQYQPLYRLFFFTISTIVSFVYFYNINHCIVCLFFTISTIVSFVFTISTIVSFVLLQPLYRFFNDINHCIAWFFTIYRYQTLHRLFFLRGQPLCRLVFYSINHCIVCFRISTIVSFLLQYQPFHRFLQYQPLYRLFVFYDVNHCLIWFFAVVTAIVFVRNLGHGGVPPSGCPFIFAPQGRGLGWRVYAAIGWIGYLYHGRYNCW